MRKLFSKSHERQKGSFDASEIEIIGVGCGGTNIVNYMQTHGFKDFPLAVCDMDASVIEHSKVREKLLFGMDGLGAGNNPELGKSEAEKKMMDIRSIIKEHTKVSFVVVSRRSDVAAPLVRVIRVHTSFIVCYVLLSSAC